MSSLFQRSHIQHVAKTVLQLTLLILIWWLGAWMQSTFHLPISAGVIGLLLLLLALLSGVFKLHWIKQGSDFILAELVLFFVPCIIGLVKYKQLLLAQGTQLILAVVLGTICVMVITAYSVHLGFKLEQYLKQRRLLQHPHHIDEQQQHTGEIK